MAAQPWAAFLLHADGTCQGPLRINALIVRLTLDFSPECILNPASMLESRWKHNADWRGGETHGAYSGRNPVL